MLDEQPRIFRLRSSHPCCAALLLFVGLAVLAPRPSGAESIYVGPTASGCDYSTLGAAFLRAAVTAESDTIFITQNLTHSGGSALALVNESAVVFRGAVGCGNPTLTRRDITTTVGDLFRFENTNATINTLRLIGDTGGRLIEMSGAAILTLQDANLRNGRADSGGNLYLSGGSSLVAFDSIVFGGQATFNGGGIFCTGGGTVGIGAGSSVNMNRADFHGGGIYANDCTVNVLAGGSIVGTSFGVFDNRADFHGGGIYATGGSLVQIIGSGTTPSTLRANVAELDGGGLYLTGSGTQAVISSAEVVDNGAYDDGGAFFVGNSAHLEMNRLSGDCDRGVRCSDLSENYAGISSGGEAVGGALAVFTGGDAFIRQTYLTKNQSFDGGNVVLVDGGGSTALIENSVLFDNYRINTHVVARNGGTARLALVSAWGSSDPGFAMAFAQATGSGVVELLSSIVIEGQGANPLGGTPDPVFLPPTSGGTHLSDCLIVHETGSLTPAGTSLAIGDPTAVFAAPAGGDPHLHEFSPAIDYCDDLFHTPGSNDIDDEARPIDDPSIPEIHGTYDLGADERDPTEPPPPAGLIFADGFESGNFAAWSSAVPS